MQSPPKILRFQAGAFLVGVVVSLLVYFGFSETAPLKLTVVPALLAANVVDDQWFFGGSWKGDVAFWLTVAAQWIVVGSVAFGAWSLVTRKKNA